MGDGLPGPTAVSSQRLLDPVAGFQGHGEGGERQEEREHRGTDRGQERQAVKDFTRDQTKYKDHNEFHCDLCILYDRV